MGSGSIFEFKVDGKAQMEIDSANMKAQLIARNPDRSQEIDTLIAQREFDVFRLNAKGITWTKEGDFYVLSTPDNHGFMKYKLINNKLEVWTSKGKSGLEFSKINRSEPDLKLRFRFDLTSKLHLLNLS